MHTHTCTTPGHETNATKKDEGITFLYILFNDYCERLKWYKKMYVIYFFICILRRQLAILNQGNNCNKDNQINVRLLVFFYILFNDYCEGFKWYKKCTLYIFWSCALRRQGNNRNKDNQVNIVNLFVILQITKDY